MKSRRKNCKEPKKEKQKKQFVYLESKPDLPFPQVTWQGAPIFDENAVKELKEALLPPEQTPIERNWISELSCVALKFLKKKPLKQPKPLSKYLEELNQFIETLRDMMAFDRRHPELYADLVISPVKVKPEDAQQAFIRLSEDARTLLLEAICLHNEIKGEKPSKGGRRRGKLSDPNFDRLLRELLLFYKEHNGHGGSLKTTAGQLNKNMTRFVRSTLDHINKHCTERILYSLDSRDRSTTLNARLKRIIK